MENKISVGEAASLWLLGYKNKSAFFDAELYSFLYEIRDTKEFQGQSIKGLRKNSNLDTKFLEVSEYLLANRLVKKNNDKYFTIGSRDPDELEVVCSLYNNGYISYLSAMRFYNITNRIPKRIDYVAPTRATWKELEKSNLSNLGIEGRHLNSVNFSTPYPSEKLKIKNTYLNVHTRSQLYLPKNKGMNVRIIDIDTLFLEMLRHPDLCGGFQHVLEVYEDMAEALLEEIIASTDVYGTAIDKCRLGFILECHLGIEHAKVADWKENFPARGGSRKMISNKPYSNNYSEDWCISLNHSVFN